jgi:tetratricopeptide (TPR) repeat protein
VLVVFKRISLASLLIVSSVWGFAQPIYAQALIPHIMQPDQKKLEEQGLSLAQEAAQLAQFQQFSLALSRAQLASQLLPTNPQVWALLGSLYLETGEIDPGIQALLKSRALDQTNEAVLFALGSAYFRQEKYETAIQYTQAGLRLKPEVPEALFDLGNAYYQLQRYDDAIAQYEKAVKIDAKFWPAINNIGLVLYEKGEADAALERWRQAVSIDANQAEPQLAIAIALFAKGDTEQAVSMGEAALRIDNRYSDPEFLQQNLWGDRLVNRAKEFLALPQMRDAIAQLSGTPAQPQPPQ